MLNETIHCRDESELAANARRFAPLLKMGDVCLLYGEMGAGKTTFTREVFLALGGKIDYFSSPTYSIVNEYPLEAGKVFHVDLYRLKGLEDCDELDQNSWLNPQNAMSFIEWPERLGQTDVSSAYRVELAHAELGRELKIQEVDA